MADTVDNPNTRIGLLAQTFPSLRNAPGISPWNALTVDAWAATPEPSHGELCAAQFVLAVWNPDYEWRSGKFDVMEALRVWDIYHREAFLAWASAPWWA